MRKLTVAMALLCVCSLFVGVGPALGKENAPAKGGKSGSASALPDAGMAVRIGLGPNKSVVAELMVDKADWELMERADSDEIRDVVLTTSPKYPKHKLHLSVGPADAGWTLTQVQEHQKDLVGETGEVKTLTLKSGKLTTEGQWFQYSADDGSYVAGWGTAVEGQWVRVWVSGDQLPISITAAEAALKGFKLTPSAKDKTAEGVFVTRLYQGTRISFTLPPTWTDRQRFTNGTEFEGLRMPLSDDEKVRSKAEQDMKVVLPARWLGLEPMKLAKKDATLQSVVADEVERLKKDRSGFTVLPDPASQKTVVFGKVGNLAVAYLNLEIENEITGNFPTRRMMCVSNGVLFRLTISGKPGTRPEAMQSDEFKEIFDSVTVGD